MQPFAYTDDRLFCEEVALEEIAEAVGTPVYVYSQGAIEHNLRAFMEGFGAYPAMVCYAVKANSNLAVLAAIARAGGGADIVSAGELARALAAGIAPQRIVFSGVGKGPWELEQALKAGIGLVNVESFQELEALEAAAKALGVRAAMGVRVNPDVDPKTHPKITTGLRENKFGLPPQQARELYRLAAGSAHLLPKAISCHIGSQLTELSPILEAARRIRSMAEELIADGLPIDTVDMGGGVGIRYRDESPPSPWDYARALVEIFRELGVKLIVEPGRAIVGKAGVLLTRVIYTKPGPGKTFVIVDGAMNDLARPSLYGAWHEILPVSRGKAREVVADVVGPICETGDFLAKGRRMPEPAPGQLLAVMDAGAYGFSMASNYNSRPRAAEVMVKGRRWAVVRERETIAQLMAGERVAEWMECS